MSVLQHFLFLAAVAIATYVQTLTGFAFGLVLLGIAGVLHLAPLPDVANAVSVLVLANALVIFARARVGVSWRVLGPALASSLAGVWLGVRLLSWLDGHAVEVLRGLLGCAIVACALLLVVQARPRPRISGAPSFVFFGGLGGVMGGLFSSAGPPIVFHFYRQPLTQDAIRSSLIVLFAANAVVRLALVHHQGGFQPLSLALSLEALPVVVLLTWLARRFPPRWSVQAVRRAVFVLLMAAGLGLALPSTPLLLGYLPVWHQ